MDGFSLHLRNAAFNRIAALSVAAHERNPKGGFELDTLAAECPPHPAQSSGGLLNGFVRSFLPVDRVPMSVRELEVLLALCKAAPDLTSVENAERLLQQLAPYLTESPSQLISASPLLKNIQPSPWECLTFNLTSALLQIGLNFPQLRDEVQDAVTGYLEKVGAGSQSDPENEDSGSQLILVVLSFLGFMDAATAHASFWNIRQRVAVLNVIKQILSDSFLVDVETTFSTIRNSHSWDTREWKRYSKHYAAIGRPLGAMLLQKGFQRFLAASCAALIADPSMLKNEHVLDILMSGSGFAQTSPGIDQEKVNMNEVVEVLADMASHGMALVEDGADYLQLGTVQWEQRLAFSVKSNALTSFACCVSINDELADSQTLVRWLEATMGNNIQMADEELAAVTLKIMAFLSKSDTHFAASLSRTLPRFIVRGSPSSVTVNVAAECLAYTLQFLSQDAIITTLYTLGNVISSGNPERGLTAASYREKFLNTEHHTSMGSAISLSLSTDEEKNQVYASVTEAIGGVAKSCKDDKIIALAQSILLQKLMKVGPAVDAKIITEVANLALVTGTNEFRSILKTYNKLSEDAEARGDSSMMSAILAARKQMAESIKSDSPLFTIYLGSLLESIISKGDLREHEAKRQMDVELAARGISLILVPLAMLLKHRAKDSYKTLEPELLPSFRDAWFNIVVHGFTVSSERAKKFTPELQIIARCSPPLVADIRAAQIESDLELNTVLRRGMNGVNTVEMKKKLVALLPNSEAEIRSLTYPTVTFLHAAYLVESLRSDSGDVSKLLMYFIDPSLRAGESANVMLALANKVIDNYFRVNLRQETPASEVSQQLVEIFVGCCHRVEKVQSVALLCAERIIEAIPSALCQKAAIFALLELLSLMWVGCLEEETDEYSWQSTFTSARANVTIELSDNYASRKRALKVLQAKARVWLQKAINISPMDVKGLLQTYLSEYDDDGSFGHIALGRSFAVEMGSVVPETDFRLVPLRTSGEMNSDTASDFIAQYTTRQAYRQSENYMDIEEGLNLTNGIKAAAENSLAQFAVETEEVRAELAALETRATERRLPQFPEIRDTLRRAAALLCKSPTTKIDTCTIRQLVRIPFLIFTKASIKLGISLWLGVINESPHLESRFLIEITWNWEWTVRKKIGLFSKRLKTPDAFLMKMEYAPSSQEEIVHHREHANAVLGPHLRLLQMLSSRFHAVRHGNLEVQRVFQRLVLITLPALREATGHPLAREVRFQMILFSLQVLLYCKNVSQTDLHDILRGEVVSAGLGWFRNPPQWSYGGNRVQLKAEISYLTSIVQILQRNPVPTIVPAKKRQQMLLKQDLLIMLLESEIGRLATWLHPLDSKRFVPPRPPADNSVVLLLPTAWNESPALAIHLLKRFHSPRLADEVRKLLLSYPEKAVSVPDALPILLGDKIPNDVSFQLKYLLYWAPLDPISAAVYFLPSYANNPCILQYAMNSLESYSVDMTFFYVPQIVQALRYDSLGYVKQFILEAAKFSQLFAHQIIWNMKANAFKDEEGTIPDPVKPTLDICMKDLIGSFSDEDREFYEREFKFFGEVTSISGKLRPYIRKSKAEKKAKIEEELRKIKVDVGVYVPSNPDGVVIGIDRKSGKPLQSHAKAPFMATFRIQKQIKSHSESSTDLLALASTASSKDKAQAQTQEKQQQQETVDAWLSAIFKVGDDCRQDMLVLQLISGFRSIFKSVGLPVYVFPYRVLATAPGCGVIDLIPNSISRDMLGREAVNGLYDYFTSKYGSEDSLAFQSARSNFVKSMAAYSVISYLLQLKDRHNGNIMIDDLGHIIHIDFGFCFDIAPGGITFERAPFKLTGEMVAVMGGSQESQSFRWFEELCVKAFLATRGYAERLSYCVTLMIDSGLPCFKPETIQHFKERFVLDKTEREAAEYMRGLVTKSFKSYTTKGYDQFQLLTNGIPY